MMLAPWRRFKFHSFRRALAGCPACAENLQNFWCDYVCKPDQSFITIIGVKEVPDPENGGDDGGPATATVLEVNVLMDKLSAVDLFASCADTTAVKNNSAVDNVVSFLRFYGQTEALGHGTDINFFYTNASTPTDSPRMVLDNLECNNYTLPGSNVSASCACSVCAASCTGSATTPGVPESESGPSPCSSSGRGCGGTLVFVEPLEREAGESASGSHAGDSETDVLPMAVLMGVALSVALVTAAVMHAYRRSGAAVVQF